MFLRLKDRPAVVQPVSEGVAPTTPIIKKRQEIPDTAVSNLYLEDVDDYDEQNATTGVVSMHPYHTTEKRIEHREFSAEKKLRFDNSPCIEEMLQIRKRHLKDQAKREKLEAEKEKKRQAQEAKMKELEEAIRTGNVEHLDLDLDADENTAEVDIDDADPDSAEFRAIALFMKEKKLTATRNSSLMHRPLGRWRRFRTAWKAYWSNGRNFDPATQVLPWLWMGRGNLARDSQFLEGMGFTHIMNCTKEMPNYHSGKFIYQRIPIDDSEEADAGARFKKAIEFIKRVAMAKGKLYIHCTVGASRAPTMCMAYFIQVRKIALLDIFKYLQAIRTVVEPNKHFLYQLAELEIRQGRGSSVFHHKLWRAYEYNSIRGDITMLRDTEGVYTTCRRIHSVENAALDYVDDMEAELERRALANVGN